MEKAILKTITEYSLQIEEYSEKAFEYIKDNNATQALLELQKAALINECMRSLCNNIQTVYSDE